MLPHDLCLPWRPQFVEDAARAQDFLETARAAAQPTWSKIDVDKPDAATVVGLLGKALAQLTEVYAWVRLSDPPLRLDHATVGEMCAFEQELQEGLDGKPKPQERCIVMFPALLSSNGTVFLKAQVVPSTDAPASAEAVPPASPDPVRPAGKPPSTPATGQSGRTRRSAQPGASSYRRSMSFSTLRPVVPRWR